MTDREVLESCRRLEGELREQLRNVDRVGGTRAR